jgi:hypothetical protein
MNAADYALLRLSLAFVWLLTAAASLWELEGQSRQLLASAGIRSLPVADALVLCGAAFDTLFGVLLWRKPVAWVYVGALAGSIGMTLIASYLLPGLWFHPFGPLSKNVPIVAALWVLFRGKK